MRDDLPELAADAYPPPHARRGLIAALALVFLLGSSSLSGSEMFPFFSWSLFSFVPNEVSRYEARLLARNGEALAAPLMLNDSADWRRRLTVRDLNLLRHLGQALVRGDEVAAETARWALEDLFAPGDVIEVGEVRYQPLERLRGVPPSWKAVGRMSF